MEIGFFFPLVLPQYKFIEQLLARLNDNSIVNNYIISCFALRMGIIQGNILV